MIVGVVRMHFATAVFEEITTSGPASWGAKPVRSTAYYNACASITLMLDVGFQAN